MAELQETTEEATVATDASSAVATVLDEFTGWIKGRVGEGSKAPRTLAWYADYLTSFLEYLRFQEPDRPQVPSITADQLQPLHVYRWVDSHPDWKSGKRGSMVAVQRAFNWAAKAGLLNALGGRSSRLCLRFGVSPVFIPEGEPQFNGSVEVGKGTTHNPKIHRRKNTWPHISKIINSRSDRSHSQVENFSRRPFQKDAAAELLPGW